MGEGRETLALSAALPRGYGMVLWKTVWLCGNVSVKRRCSQE